MDFLWRRSTSGFPFCQPFFLLRAGLCAQRCDTETLLTVTQGGVHRGAQSLRAPRPRAWRCPVLNAGAETRLQRRGPPARTPPAWSHDADLPARRGCEFRRSLSRKNRAADNYEGDVCQVLFFSFLTCHPPPTPPPGRSGVQLATNMTGCLLLCCLLTCAAGHQSQARLPFFHGHIFENSPAASKVSALSIPARRINAQRWCQLPATRLSLHGNGSEDFRVFAHHKRGNVLLKTSRLLDREARAQYLLSVALCCQTRASESSVVEVASVKVDVLDTNDHEPTFAHAERIRLSLADTAALRSAVYQLRAADGDSGRNAELTYASTPPNGTFYVVPKTGEVLLVDSILGLSSTLSFYVYARDHGWPPLTSKAVLVTVDPRRWPTRPADAPAAGRHPRALLESGTVTTLNVSEDAGVGSIITSLNPARFQAAAYELVHPEGGSSPVSVGRDSGDLAITRRLDRETEPVVELTVKIRDKRGVWNNQSF